MDRCRLMVTALEFRCFNQKMFCFQLAPAQFVVRLASTTWLQNAKEPQACCLWMADINMPSMLLTGLIYHVWYSLPVTDLFTISELSPLNSSLSCLVLVAVHVTCTCCHFSICVCLRACHCLRLCVSRDVVFDMTRGDLPSAFSILFLSWHVEPRSLLSWWQWWLTAPLSLEDRFVWSAFLYYLGCFPWFSVGKS